MMGYRLTEHASLSREAVRRRLAENDLKPWREDVRCIAQVGAEYVARMEDVLDLYAEAPDPKHPVVCFDETPTQLIGEFRQPIRAHSGQIERYDCEYKRNGTVNLFVFLDVHRPWRKVKVTDSRTAVDFATCMRELTDVDFPAAERIDPCRRGQSADPFRRGALPSLPRLRSATRAAPTGVPLCTQACQLVGRLRSASYVANASTDASPPGRNSSLRLPPGNDSARSPYQMDVHNRKSPSQNGSRLPRTGRPDRLLNRQIGRLLALDVRPV
jgi:DDE superfamily endonuclease